MRDIDIDQGAEVSTDEKVGNMTTIVAAEAEEETLADLFQEENE